MKIGQFTDSFLPVVDGVGRVVSSYAREMATEGHEVTVAAAQADMGDVEALPYRVVTYHSFLMPGKMPYRIGFPQLDIGFERQMQDISLDIVHVHSPFMAGRAGLHLARKRGIPVIGSFHSKYYDDFCQALKMDALAKTGVKYVVDFYEGCDEVWAVSHDTAGTLREYGYRGNVVTMQNGTDIRTLDEAVLPELRSRYQLREEVPLLLFVGQLNWKKNIRCTLEAVRILRETGFPTRLLLAGQGPHREEIEQAGETLGIADAMTFTGHVQSARELDGLYALADLFVFPSLYDNAPLVVREAAAMGTPSVLVEGSNAAEGIENGVNGFTCEDDPDALAKAVRGALADPQALCRIGAEARETIPVSWATLMRQVLARYAQLIERRA